MMARKTIPAAVEERVRRAARHRCGYCLSPQHLVMARLHIKHLVPLSRGGTDDEINLWLACPICNGHKADKIAETDPETGLIASLFNPRTQAWRDHFHWVERGLRIVGQTTTGRATVVALHLDTDPDALAVRRYCIEAGWYPPPD